MDQYDGVLVPGGGLTPDGRPNPWVIQRLDSARMVAAEPYLICLSAGTPHKPPPLNSKGFPILESAASADYLLEKGIPGKRLLKEISSLDTIGNAYFARVDHIDPLGLRRLLVITSEFHMARTKAVFDVVLRLRSDRATTLESLDYRATPDDLVPDLELSKRRKTETESLQKWHETLTEQRFSDLSQFHRWLFTRHGAYASGVRVVRRPAGELGGY